MNPAVRLYRSVRAALGRAFAPRQGTGAIVVVRAPDRKGVSQTAVEVGSWDRTFEECQAVIQSHEGGTFRASGVLADALDRNPRIFGALNNRALGVVGAPFSMLEGLGDQRRVAAVVRAAEEDWPLMCPEETLAELLRGLVTMGFALARKRVVKVRGRWVPVLEPWHGSFLRWDVYRECFMALTYEDGEVPIRPGDGWVLLAASSRRPWMRAVVRCLGIPAETRKHAATDWSRWSEKHGLPIVELKVPAAKAESDETDEFFEQMRDLRSDTTIISPQGEGDQASYGVNLVEARDTAWEGFKELIARADGDVSIAIEGQNLSTENTTVGAKASAAVGHGIRQDLREADAWVVATTLHEQLLRPWAKWNFGDEDVAPWAVYDPTPPEDLAAKASTWNTAAKALTGWNGALREAKKRVNATEVAELFGVPIEDLPDELAARPANDPAAPAPLDEGDTATARAKASARRFLARRHLLSLRAAA